VNPAKIQSLLQEALKQHQSGRLDLARAGYAKVRKAAPRHFSATHLAGVPELAAGRLEETEKIMRRALKLDRLSTPCEEELAMVLLLRGRLDEAEKRLRNVQKKNPTETAEPDSIRQVSS
jgi:Flp pilus assembly protein TadD